MRFVLDLIISSIGILFFIQVSVSAQNVIIYNCQDSFLKKIDDLTLIDDEIINGIFYSLPDKRIKGNPFIFDKIFENGTIYNSGNGYNQYRLNYDLIADKLIINVEKYYGTDIYIAVNKNQVDSFIIGKLVIVNSNCIAKNGSKRNYYEQIFKSNLISLYKSHEKRFIDMYDEFSYPLGKFSETNTRLFLIKKDTLINISSINSFLKCFKEEHRKEIQKYIRKHNVQLKNASNEVLIDLMQYCIEISSK